jgi:hypothetical protein
MILEINKYIDFKELFNDLFKTHEVDLIKHRYEAKHYDDIIKFKEYYYKDFEILTEECEYGKEITFIFFHDFSDSNESNPQSSSAHYIIVYDSILDEFVSCEYEQG